jgi:hypothetical protein
MTLGDTFMNEKKGERMSAEASLEEKSLDKVVEETYFFHSMGSSSENEEVKNSEAEMECEMQELLKSINEETSQLNQLLMEEKTLINETCMSVRQILKTLNISCNIPSHKIPLGKGAKKAILNEEGCMVIVDEKGAVNTTSLAECSPEVVMAVLWIILPELIKAARMYKKRVSARVDIFAKIKKELKGMINTIIGTKEATALAENKT